MWRFLVDEDLPRSTSRALVAAGHQSVDVRDVGLRGHSDEDVFAYAQQHAAVLVTADKGFASILSFPLGTHFGIIVLRLPNELTTRQLNQELLRALSNLEGEPLSGMLVIVEPGTVRLRRPPPSTNAE